MIEAREHLLISRVVDGDGGDGEWSELETLAQSEPKLWRELAVAQRDQSCLMRAMTGATAVADSVGLQQVHRRNWNRLNAWSGWAVAAVLAVVASAQLARPSDTTGPADQLKLAGLPVQSAAQAFQAYLDKGRESGEVVGEVPAKVLVESRPALSGEGYELTYLRQILERIYVPDLFEVDGQNELGQPTLIRYEPRVRGSM